MAGGLKKEIRKWLNGIVYAVYLVYCRFCFGKNIRLIDLTKYKFAIVDKEDYERLKIFKWRPRYCSNSWYAVRCRKVGEKKGNILVWMHNVILPPPKGKMIDHRNHNGLNNRKSNLRIATRSENMQNRRKWKTPCSSVFKGVVHRNYHNRRKLWNGYISVNGRTICLGCFMTELEAAMAYDRAALKYHGEFACLNFPRNKDKTRLSAIALRSFMRRKGRDEIPRQNKI